MLNPQIWIRVVEYHKQVYDIFYSSLDGIILGFFLVLFVQLSMLQPN